MRNIKLIGCLIFTYTSMVFSQVKQDTIYVNINEDLISKEKFQLKFKQGLYDSFLFNSDTLVCYTLKSKYNFGVLKNSTKNQLFKLLSQRHSIDTTKTLVIHYLDSLRNRNAFSKRNKVIYYNDKQEEVEMPKHGDKVTVKSLYNTVSAVTHKHFTKYKSFLINQRKCSRYHNKIGKGKVLVLHFYNKKDTHPDVLKKNRWYKDYGQIFKRIFFRNNEKFSYVIIHPNGDFFVDYSTTYQYECMFSYSDLILKKNWNKHKKIFLSNLDK